MLGRSVRVLSCSARGKQARSPSAVATCLGGCGKGETRTVRSHAPSLVRAHRRQRGSGYPPCCRWKNRRCLQRTRLPCRTLLYPGGTMALRSHHSPRPNQRAYLFATARMIPQAGRLVKETTERPRQREQAQEVVVRTAFEGHRFAIGLPGACRGRAWNSRARL
jgi:hypothetical protein